MAALVTLDEVKAWLTVEHTDDDAFLTAAALLCSSWVEGQCGRGFVSEGRQTTRDGGQSFLILSNPPVTSIVSVTDQDSGDALDVADFDFYSDSGLLYLVSGADWNTGRQRYLIDYVSGFTLVPDEIKAAVNSLISLAYDQRDLEATQERLGQWSKSNGHGPGSIVMDALSRYKLEAF